MGYHDAAAPSTATAATPAALPLHSRNANRVYSFTAATASAVCSRQLLLVLQLIVIVVSTVSDCRCC
jgi:hypothetical protein